MTAGKDSLRVALAQRDFAVLSEQRTAYAQGERPLSIHLLLDRISDDGAVPMSALSAPRGAVAISWHFGADLLTWRATGRCFAILVWGIPKRDRIRTALARHILKLASAVLVNDPKSAAEVMALSGRNAVQVPFLVDTDYYQFSSKENRDGFLFCPGSIDRDGDALLELARAGRRVVWMNNDLALIERYKGISENLEIVTRPSFETLRHLYATCAACIVPLCADLHAAGQTTSLEALASGAPLFLSAGRTAEIFKERSLCTVVNDNTLESWQQAVDALPEDAELQRRRRIVENTYSPDVLAQQYRAELNAARPA